MAEMGLPAAVFMLWMLIVLFKKGFRKLNHPSRLVRASTLGALSAIVAILCHSLSDFNLHIPANAIMFTVLAAIVTAPPPLLNRSAPDPAIGVFRNKRTLMVTVHHEPQNIIPVCKKATVKPNTVTESVAM